MSDLLSKASSGVEDGVVSPLLQHITEYTGVSDSTAMLGLTVLGATATLLLAWRLLLAEPSNLPPGPRRLPLLGNLLDLAKDPRIQESLFKLQQKYGDIMTVYFGPKRTIVLGSHELVREAFVRQGDATSDRPYMLIMDIFTGNGQDIVQADLSPRMQMQRKLAHQALRKFSSGGGLANYTRKAFKAFSEKLDADPQLDGTDMGFLVSYNILLSMCFGKSYSFEDDFFKEMLQRTKQLDELFQTIGARDMMTISRYLPLSAKMLKVKEFADRLKSFIEETLEEHKKSFNKDKLTDFTYHLLDVMQEAENDPNESSNLKLLTANHYIYLLMDLFSAGTDTTRMTLNWIWHFLAAYPEVQRRAQKEVDSVIGRDGEVTSESRESLPYVDAVLHEVLRIKTVAAIGLFHKTREDIKLGGYDIPKGSSILSNTWAIHYNPKYWEDPEAFLPERWLDESGKYQYQQTGFVPFSMGRRSCIGESFVKLELHMLTTMLLQRYTLEATPGYTVSVELGPHMNVMPVEQKPIIAKRR